MDRLLKNNKVQVDKFFPEYASFIVQTSTVAEPISTYIQMAEVIKKMNF